MSYFKYFPRIEYNNVQSFNIVSRAKILEDIIRRYSVFYKYTVNQDERPDQVSFKYYDSEQYTWLVFLSNQIFDPYFQWVLTEKELENYIISKYNITLQESLNKILHYKFEGIQTRIEEGFDTTGERADIIDWKMSPTTYNYLSQIDSTRIIGWKPVYVYDYEQEENDKRRNIFLLSKQYISKIESDLKRAFS